MEVITSLDNKRIKTLAKLLNKKYRDETGMFLVEGEHLVIEAERAGSLMEVIKCEDYEMDFQDSKDYCRIARYFEVQDMQVELFDENLAEAMLHLQPDLRDVVLLYYILGYNNEEVAIICKCTERTVIRRKEKALDRLREELRAAYE